MRELFASIVLVSVLAPASLGVAGPLGRQAGGRQGRAGGEEEAVSPAEIQRMFDGYALMQAQEQLKIGDDQFSQFVTRYKTLQDVRRKGLQEHAKLVNEMRRMLNAGSPDETVLSDRLKALQELDARTADDVKKAYEAIDQVLNVSQQAKFRVFEENMERRKLDLVTRARQANRPKQQ